MSGAERLRLGYSWFILSHFRVFHFVDHCSPLAPRARLLVVSKRLFAIRARICKIVRASPCLSCGATGLHKSYQLIFARHPGWLACL